MYYYVIGLSVFREPNMVDMVKLIPIKYTIDVYW